MIVQKIGNLQAMRRLARPLSGASSMVLPTKRPANMARPCIGNLRSRKYARRLLRQSAQSDLSI